MFGYMGEFHVAVDKTKEEWALYFIESYGQFGGQHHKAWVLDQIARILHGTPVNAREARWKDGTTELRVDTGEPSDEYIAWVSEMQGEYNADMNEYEYFYDKGIAP